MEDEVLNPIEGQDDGGSVEDFDFDWGTQDDGAVEPSAADPEPQPKIDPAEVERLRQEKADLERWQQDALRNPHLLAALPQAQNPYQNLTPEQQNQELLKQLVQNPAGTLDQYFNLKKQEIAAEQEGLAIINEYRSKHPELTQYEPYIEIEVQAAIQEAMQQRKPLTQREALEAGIQRFKQKMSPIQQQGAGQAAQREAMRLDLGGSPHASKKIDAAAIEAMTPEEFAKFDAQIERQLNQKHYRL